MSLIYCPECGHEISTAAVACPSCGRPINSKPESAPRVIVDREPKSDTIPPWVIVPVVLLGVIVIFGLIYFMTAESDDETRIAINANARRSESTRSSDRTDADTSASDYPASARSTSVPDSSSASDVPTTSSQTVQGSTVPVPDKATVLINAKVVEKAGSAPQAVRNTKFYLLDKDIETILSDAELEPIGGQTLSTSFAMAIADQSRHSVFYRDAMKAIRAHIKYAGTTDSAGQAKLGSVEPDSYYLFGVAKSGTGFAVWNSSVSVINGENLMNLSPQRVTSMPSATSEE